MARNVLSTWYVPANFVTDAAYLVGRPLPNQNREAPLLHKSAKAMGKKNSAPLRNQNREAPLLQKSAIAPMAKNSAPLPNQNREAPHSTNIRYCANGKK